MAGHAGEVRDRVARERVFFAVRQGHVLTAVEGGVPLAGGRRPADTGGGNAGGYRATAKRGRGGRRTAEVDVPVRQRLAALAKVGNAPSSMGVPSNTAVKLACAVKVPMRAFSPTWLRVTYLPIAPPLNVAVPVSSLKLLSATVTGLPSPSTPPPP